MAPVIFVASVPHTGTWSTIELIQHLTHHRVSQAYRILEGKQPEGILHAHIGDAVLANPDERAKYFDSFTINLLAGLFKTVIPVRDPMRSLITRQMRHPDLQHFHIVDGFKTLARIYGNRNIHWLTLDLITHPIQQRASENALAAFLGAYPYQCDWTPANQTFGDNAIRDAYKAGNMKPLKEKCKEEVEALQDNNEIKEFLKRLGYVLPWM